MTPITIFGIKIDPSDNGKKIIYGTSVNVIIQSKHNDNGKYTVKIDGSFKQKNNEIAFLEFKKLELLIALSDDCISEASYIGGEIMITNTLINITGIKKLHWERNTLLGFTPSKVDAITLSKIPSNPHGLLSSFCNLEHSFKEMPLRINLSLLSSQSEEGLEIEVVLDNETQAFDLHILEWISDYKDPENELDQSIKQAFAFHSARFNANENEYTIAYRPRYASGIYLSPDILDPTKPLDSQNNFLYQHIVLDSYLEAKFSISTSSTWEIKEWILTPKDINNGLILATPALRDENGYPLIVRVMAHLPLMLRGSNAICLANQEMNEAIVLGVAEEKEFDCEMVSFSPIERPSSQMTLAEKRYIADPPWVNSSIIKKAPREIIGWSRNGVMRLSKRDPLPCKLHLKPIIVNNNTRASYVFATILFSAVGAKLLVDLPDKESKPINSESSGNLQRLEGDGKAECTISLPLCDTAWAFADLSGPSQSDPNESEQSLASEISKVLFDLNSKLVEAFEPPKESKYRHIEGHRGQLPQQVFEQLLSVPPITTVSNGSGRNWLALAPSETTIKMPSSTEAPIASPGSVFLFGGNNDNDNDFDLATKLLNGQATELERKQNKIDGFFPIKLPQGESELLSKVKGQWTSNEQLRTIRQQYGEFLSPGVLQRIIDKEIDSEFLLKQLKESGINLSTLDDLLTKPSDYLVLSKSCPAANSKGSEQSVGLYKLNFDFCKLSGGKEWKMGFDNEVTFIVKLGGDRSLKDILVELNTTYQKDGDNPFGLAGGLQSFIAQLPAELLVPSWRGVLVVNPQIALDEYFKDLCGLSSITGTYAAITGHTNQNSPIDVWGRIDQRAKPDESNGGDSAVCSWALVKFEATIKNTSILAAEIQFRLQINELLGKKANYPPVDVFGSLKAAASKEPRDFSFAASFKSPLRYDINESFLDSILLHSVKIGKYKGQAALALDADLKLRCEDPIINDPPKDPLKLTNFYILLPKQDKDEKITFGQWVDLAFDLGGIRVSLPDKEGSKLRILGFEIKPVGIGILKGNQSNIRKTLDVETIGLKPPSFNNNNNTIYSYPYLDTLVQFGEDLDVKGENQLSFTLRSGTPIPSEGCKPGAGLASLQGKNVKLSLFGLLTVSAEEVSAKPTSLIDPDNQNADKVRAAVVEVNNFNLGILSWNMFENGGDRKLIFAQSADGLSKGVLGWYATADRHSSKFFQLHWLLLARNFDPGKKVKNALLTPNNPLTNGLDLENVDTLNAKLDNDNCWLFGFAFSLSSLFTDCAFFLHEKSYYGIRLGGEVAKLLTGEEVIALAYIPGEKPELSRFRTEFRCPALDMIGDLRSGLMALEWAPNWDFVLDFGFPWRVPAGYEWSRAFSMPVGVYEAQFGFFIERRTTLTQNKTELTLSAGAGFYLGYKYEAKTKLSKVRAGIGIYGVLIGSATLAIPGSSGLIAREILQSSLTKLSVTGALGIYAYGEGSVDLWIITARFKISAQACVTVNLIYVPKHGGLITWDATLSASYSAKVTVGRGLFSTQVTKEGTISFRIEGHAHF